MTKITCPNCNKEYNIDSKLNWKKVKCDCENIFTINIEPEEKAKETNNNNLPSLNLKPNKRSYILLWSPVGFLLFITLLVLLFDITIWVLSWIVTLIMYFWYNIKYKKEEYIIENNKIIYNYWNLFSDNSVEVNINRITQVTSILWFIQNLIFKTWHLLISTAWSNNSKLILKNIDKPLEVYENIQASMKNNWFALQKNKLVQEARPHWLWIVGEIIWKALVNLFIIFYVLIDGLAASEELSDQAFDFLSVIFIILLVIFIAWFFATFIFSYLDLKRRKYDIYTDSIFYTEWFLTKVYSFLPMESVSDTENVQSFWSKIFWIHDVIVSSEWSNNKVIFKNMTHWEQMMKNIKYLKDNTIMQETNNTEVSETTNQNDIVWYKNKIETPLNYDKEFKAEYKMSYLKSIVVLLPLLLMPPVFIVAVIGQIIRIIFTRFIIESSSIEKKFEFLTNKHNSFSIEKITWVTVKESILDKLLWTCSIYFSSIWSNTNIVFANIKKTQDLENNILSKVWIHKSNDHKSIEIEFNLVNFLKSSIWFAIFLTILISILFIISMFSSDLSAFMWIILVSIFVLLLLVYTYKVFYYNKSRYINNIYNDFIESISGIIFISKKYALIRNIKWIKSTKYPLTNTWDLSLNIAWEQVIEWKNNQTISILSNSINISFVKEVFNTHNSFDNILNNNSLDNQIVNNSTQDIWNTVLPLAIFFSIFILFSSLIINETIIPFIISLAITIICLWLVIWSIKVRYYNFEKQRVLFHSGIIYKKHHTILYNKFNFIEKNQWFINKIFKNWIVNIYTVGSGSIEMKVVDVSNFKEIYDLLKK